MSAWPAYIYVERYAPHPVGLALATLYLPPQAADEPLYVPRVLLLTPRDLLALWRELRKAGPVKPYFKSAQALGPATQREGR